MDVIHLIWCFVGVYIDSTYSNPKAQDRGALDACSRDYGFLFTFAFFMFIVFGFFQIIRMIFYLTSIVHHQRTFGTWEVRSRKGLNRIINQPIELKFPIISLNSFCM